MSNFTNINTACGIQLGTSGSFYVPVNGNLYLRMNDTSYIDNNMSLTVTINGSSLEVFASGWEFDGSGRLWGPVQTGIQYNYSVPSSSRWSWAGFLHGAGTQADWNKHLTDANGNFYGTLDCNNSPPCSGDLASYFSSNFLHPCLKAFSLVGYLG